MPKLLLSDTSAFVLVLDKGMSYTSPLSKKFLSRLNLSKGHMLYQYVEHLKPHLDEIVPNRKFIIHHYIRQILKNSKTPTQVVVLACGWDPILLKMSEEFPEHYFFGVDSESIHLQQKLVKELLPQAKIFYIQKNITHIPLLLKDLKKHGWNPHAPTCLVLEGITYYIPSEIFWQALQALIQNIKAECFICGDFGVDWKLESISPLSQKLLIDTFTMIERECSHSSYFYTKKQVQDALMHLGFTNTQFFTMGETQEKRTGKAQPWQAKEGHIISFTAQK